MVWTVGTCGYFSLVLFECSPADLAAVVILTIVTLASVFVPIINETPLRVIFGLCFVLFLPGYAFIAALFPEAGESPSETDEVPTDESSTSSVEKPSAVPGTDAAIAEREETATTVPSHSREGIDGIERVALSFGLSIAIVPLIGLVLNFTPWGSDSYRLPHRYLSSHSSPLL